MLKRWAVGSGLLAAMLAGQPGVHAQGIDFHAMARDAVKKSVPLLQKAAAAWPERAGNACFSCHNTSLPAMAVGLAREQGYAVDEKNEQAQAAFVYRFFARAKDGMRRGLTDPEADRQVSLQLVDPSPVIGYALAGLAAAGHPADDTTTAAARYLAFKQEKDGHWAVPGARPPLEGSEFAATALAVRALQSYMPRERAAETAEHVNRARAWLLNTPPRTTEDKAFRLFGLGWSHAGPAEIRRAVAELLAEQRDNGGWAQLTNLPTDAYATGQVLVALHQAGALPTSDAAYSRGFLYLAGTQQEDGSWLVPTRTTPFQPYFESGFPHEKAQFISCAGSSWATMALALAAPAEPAAAKTARAAAP